MCIYPCIVTVDKFCFRLYYVFSTVETGGITIAPRPAPDDSPPKPGYPSLPFFGILPELRSENVCYLYIHVPVHSECTVYICKCIHVHVCSRVFQ